jgi:hypothetical protein
MSEWINHVKAYQAANNCSYKDAMTCAKASYKKGSSTPIEGGKFNLKKAVKKATKGVKKGAKVIENNKKLVKLVVGDEYAGDIDKISRQANKASKFADMVDTQTGAGVHHLGRKLKHSIKKARHITKNVSKNIDKYAPILEMVAPELAPELIAANQVAKRINGGALGSTRKGLHNPYLKGGSFMVPHGGALTHTNSSLISPHHPAFHPKGLKTYAELIVNN